MRQEKSVVGYNNTGLNRQTLKLPGVPMFVRLLLVTFFCFDLMATALADPNTICADEVSFKSAQDLIKDRTAIGMQMLPMLNTLISAGVLPAGYDPASFYRDVHKLGLAAYGESIVQRAIEASKRKGQQVTEEKTAEARKAWASMDASMLEAQADLFNNYLIVPYQPIATSFDPNLGRVTCSFKYTLNLELLASVLQRFSPQSQELKMALQMKALQAASGYYKTGIYTVQPDGRGGTSVSILSAP